MPWKEYVPQAVGGTAVTGSLFLLMFKEAIKDWWDAKKEERALKREQRALEKGQGSTLENKLIEILEKDLANNVALLARLTDTMNDLRDISRKQTSLIEESLQISRDTRESQKWLERRFGGAA